MTEPLVLAKLREHGMSYLEEDPDQLAIKVKKYPEGLMVLNYDQIHSPKCQITGECRGLILSYPDFAVVSRSFDRFYNIGEHTNRGFKLQDTDEVANKVDGSLIKMYNWRGTWYISTRGTAFAASESGDSGSTFRDLFLASLAFPFPGHFEYLDKECTYMFELTTPDNRVVRTHEEYSFTYLAARNNATGEYVRRAATVRPMGPVWLTGHSFTDVEHCVETAASLPDLEEGYVVYRRGVPVCKIKSPIYVAAHRVFSGTMTLKKMTQLVLLGEVPEFAAYFPKYADILSNYRRALEVSLQDLDFKFVYDWNVDPWFMDAYPNVPIALTQKDFALKVKDFPHSAILFRARKEGILPSQAFWSGTDKYKLDMAMLILESRGDFATKSLQGA